MDPEIFQRTIARIAPGIAITNPDNTFEKIIWPDGFVPPTKAAFDAELERLDNPVPSSATRGQLIRVLHHIGKLTEVRDTVAQADVLTQELWLSPTFSRDDPLLRAVAATVGLTDRRRSQPTA